MAYNTTFRKLRSWHLVHHFMANRWENETVRDFILLGSKITADGNCSHEIKICLLLGRKAMTNLDNVLKSRDGTLPTKISIVKEWILLNFLKTLMLVEDS